jgi:hypothetical protein
MSFTSTNYKKLEIIINQQSIKNKDKTYQELHGIRRKPQNVRAIERVLK